VSLPAAVRKRRWKRGGLLLAGLVAATVTAVLASGGCVQPAWGAQAILHPYRRAVGPPPDLPHRDIAITNGDVVLKGWYFPASAPSPKPRPLLVYLHGSADNRQSGVGLARRFGPRGYDVLTYDGRAHGESSGAACTYGVLEKRDLMRALDAVGAHEAVLFGSSLGAAVALEAAPLDPRVRGVIAQSSFSTLRRVVHDRARWLRLVMRPGGVDAAIAIAEQQGGFLADEASPLAAAPHIQVPVLLIHGTADRETSADHSREIDRALPGPHRLLLVPGAGHNDVLGREEVWREIEAWLAMI
jgi:pimeloyl-ACP methyl ester carboxylesterase